MNKNTPTAKGVRGVYQVIAGSVVTYLAGLWALPGVKEYTTGFVKSQGLTSLVTLLATLGISTGLVVYVQNKVEDRNK